MASEEVEIEVRLSSEWWQDAPLFEVWVDDINFGNGVVAEKKLESDYKSVKWKGELSEGEHELRVVLKGKNMKGTLRPQTIRDDEGNIIKDQLLMLDNIYLDNIELGYTAIRLGKCYQFNQDGTGTHEPVRENANTFGVNCEWKLKFAVPTYMWLLENI